MIISTVRHFNTYTIGERRLKRAEFAEELKDIIIDVEELKKTIHDIISAKGRVYGIYKKKRLVGVYIFEKIENYFVKKEGTGIRLGNRDFDFDKFWYGSNTAAFRFKESICLDEVKAYAEKIEKDLRVDMTDQIWLGNVAGVDWNNQLMYRKNLAKKDSQRVLQRILGAVPGFSLGFVFGWITFHKWSMGICYGFLYMTIFGGLRIDTDTDMDTLDFINRDFIGKSGVENHATE